jgi:hypothetical protein
MKTFRKFREDILIESEERRKLAGDIHAFLAKHAKRSADEEEWSSPDAHELEHTAHQLNYGHGKVRHPNSSWESGGYHPYSDKEGRAKHDELLSRIKKHSQLSERFLTRDECLQAYYEGVKDGTIGKCSNCGSPNLSEIQENDCRECVDCGNKDAKWRITLPEDEGGAAPTNNAGGGNIAGIGVGPHGEPGVHPEYQRKRKQLEIVGPPVVDPRMFADKIFKHVSESSGPKLADWGDKTSAMPDSKGRFSKQK